MFFALWEPSLAPSAEDGSFRGDLRYANQNNSSAGAQKRLKCTSGAEQSRIYSKLLEYLIAFTALDADFPYLTILLRCDLAIF